MVTLINTNPLGDIDIPDLNLSVKAGGEFEVSRAIADELLMQTGNYAEKTAAPKKAAVAADVLTPDRGVKPDPR